MDQTAHHSRAPEDLIVALALASTWVVYLFGGLYELGPVLGVGLTGLLFVRVYLSGHADFVRTVPSTPGGVWIWIMGMLVMLLALEVGHMNQNLGLGQTKKSTIGCTERLCTALVWCASWSVLSMPTKRSTICV